MANPNVTAPAREVVGRFGDRARFQAALDELSRAGFPREDISVLSTHETLDALDRPANRTEDVKAALRGEMEYVVPLGAAGIIAVVGGPVAAVFAGLVAAGLGGMALNEYLRNVTAGAHADTFADAVREGGLILWVRVPDEATEARAHAILSTHGAEDLHVVERTTG